MNTMIKQARIQAGLSQKEVALTLHVSAPTVSEWESGKKTPTTENLVKMADLFEVSMDYLTGRYDKAVEKFGFLYPWSEMGTQKSRIYDVLQSNSSIEEKEAAATDLLMIYFSRSLGQNGYSLEHPDFNSYAAMLLNQEQFKDRFGDAIYQRLVKKYGKKPGIPEGRTTYSIDALIQRVLSTKNSKKAPSLSDEAMKMARDYDKLDNWGRQAVRDLTDTELSRMEAEAHFMSSTAPEDDSKIINLYAEPAAAGIATPTMGVDFEPYTLKTDDPHGASFAVRIQGNSMEPYFPDGSIVFVDHDAMVNGDIGIFCVDGGTVCKQYYRDPMGTVYLFSLNRKRSDADVVLSPSSNRTLICQGRVITNRRFPIPM